jgi:hypothetical protein
MVPVVMYSRDIPPPGGYEVHAPAPPRLCIHPPGDARRREVEAFIRRIYAERYGADVSGFAPMLVSLQDDDGIVAAAGYRSAAKTGCSLRATSINRSSPCSSPTPSIRCHAPTSSKSGTWRRRGPARGGVWCR